MSLMDWEGMRPDRRPLESNVQCHQKDVPANTFCGMVFYPPTAALQECRPHIARVLWALCRHLRVK